MTSSLALWLVVIAATLGHHTAASHPLVDAARQQIGVTTIYDGRYQQLAYPSGDVAIERGVCTDVVIRAFRVLGIDLQQRIHEDMKRSWHSYPKLWGLASTDRNIDHRRVPNMAHFFQRQGWRMTSSAGYQAGDIITWMLPGNLPHIGVVSDRRVGNKPLIVHNIGAGVVEEDLVDRYPMTGHYRPVLDVVSLAN